MKTKAPPMVDDKTPMERFTELGKKLMAVPKTEIDTIEPRPNSSKKKRSKRSSR